MERLPPVAPSDEINLYIRTYYSLLRSSGQVRVRAIEEAHAYSGSSLHLGALSPIPDVSAFAYAAARLPDEMQETKLVVLGQSHELFEAAGFNVRAWKPVRTRGRRRPLRFEPKTGTLGVFIASESDIDDFVPIVTAYQIEWNKMHWRLQAADLTSHAELPDANGLAEILGITVDDVAILAFAFTKSKFEAGIRALAARPSDIHLQMLASSYSQYQRAAQRWWSGIEPGYLQKEHPRRPPVYFVSSNTHAIANLVGGYARAHTKEIVEYALAKNPEGLADTVAQKRGDEAAIRPLVYYLLRGYIHDDPTGARMREVRQFEARVGLAHFSEPGHVDVDAQIMQISKIDPSLIDPRLHVPGIEALAKSDAYIINIDYPLGMAAFHLLSRVGQGVGELRGVYVMGKAASLNGRVGDVSLSGVVYDEHTRNTFLFRNALTAKDVRPYLQYGSVFDNQSALTVRSAFLQNKNYMNAFYRDGYTVLEMEAGPFLSAIYELMHPTRIPVNEIVHISDRAFEVGFLHYVSDTPNSRRQSLLSKSLSYFGVDSTYACATAIVRKIFEREVALAAGSPRLSVF